MLYILLTVKYICSQIQQINQSLIFLENKESKYYSKKKEYLLCIKIF